VRMMRAYRPRQYPGKVTVFRARTLRVGFRGTRDLGWRKLARAGVVVHAVPGSHDTILKEPRVRALAAALAKSLRTS
jgi:thioesterase domain-containing protein